MSYRTHASKTSTVHVLSDIAAVPAARRRVVSIVRSWRLPLTQDIVETVELLAGEVIANSVVHVREGCQVTVNWDGARLRVEVDDPGRSHIPLPVSSDLEAESGRGLQLVAMLAQAWGWRSTLNGNSVWFEIGTCSPPQDQASPAPDENEYSFGPAFQRLFASSPRDSPLVGFPRQTA
ncbi:ATP-binding protein [Streptomyces sp. NPDC002055]|uniref:ATP-binding protein n=1 Tax=Streptomyces sp. NPDC002055 TaxID=3154534 RepID=UPI0033222289